MARNCGKEWPLRKNRINTTGRKLSFPLTAHDMNLPCGTSSSSRVNASLSGLSALWVFVGFAMNESVQALSERIQAGRASQ
jgi:hypothetical protein